MALEVKNLPANAGDTRNSGSIPGSGRSPGGGDGNPLQYSCLGNPMDRALSLVGYSPWGRKRIRSSWPRTKHTQADSEDRFQVQIAIFHSSFLILALWPHPGSKIRQRIIKNTRRVSWRSCKTSGVGPPQPALATSPNSKTEKKGQGSPHTPLTASPNSPHLKSLMKGQMAR